MHTLQALIVGPSGDKQTVSLKQTAPGHYDANFPAVETGAYLLNVMQMENGRPVASQIIGTSLAHSPELGARGPDSGLLQRIADTTGGRVLDPSGPASNPFYHERLKTYQAQEMWEWLLRFAVIAFVLDVGVRRVQIEREEFERALRYVAAWLPFWPKAAVANASTPSLATLLSRRNELSEQQGKKHPLRERRNLPVITPSIQPELAATSSPEGTPSEGGTTSRLLEAKRRAQRGKNPSD